MSLCKKKIRIFHFNVLICRPDNSSEVLINLFFCDAFARIIRHVVLLFSFSLCCCLIIFFPEVLQPQDNVLSVDLCELFAD